MKSRTFVASLVFSCCFGSAVFSQSNVIDLHRLNVQQCVLPSVNDDLESLICNVLRPLILEDLTEAEQFLDAVFTGYRDDIPEQFRKSLDIIQIDVRFEIIDGPGGVPAQAAPTQLVAYPQMPPFEWAFATVGTINLDVDDLERLVLEDLLVDLLIHEALHAIGFPSVFEIAGLISPVNKFDLINFVGVEGGGFGLTEFRIESNNPLAEFIPLEQATGGAHLCQYEPAFVRPDDLLREVLTPTLQTACTRAFMSRSLRGMFADSGFKITGINAPGIVDLDRDGLDDDPLIISPGSGRGKIVLGDIDQNGVVNLLDVAPFISLLGNGEFLCEADLNIDGRVDLSDVGPFVAKLVN